MQLVAAGSAVLQEALAVSGREHGPGLFGLVTENGQVVFAGSAGVADLTRPRPPRAQDLVRIGSVTKVYVAALVLALADEGVLALADPVARWLPGAVPGGEQITVEMLLAMRSGLPDYTGPLFGDPPDRGVLDRYWSPGELVGRAVAAPDRWQPGAGYRYSNSDYVLLGLVAEKAAGHRADALLWQKIFQPLSLRDTMLPIADPYLRGPHATGYLRDGPDQPWTECTTITPSESWTSGAIVATARDVAAFLDGLLSGTLLAPRALARMTDCTQPLDAHRSRGLGIVRYDLGTGTVAFGHAGGIPGYSTVAMRTEAGRCVILWQNGFAIHDPLTCYTPFIQAALPS